LLAPRPVPDAIAGPADPHVAATFYNPAALGMLRGFHLFLDGGARTNLGSIDRDPIDGTPGGHADIRFANLDSFAGLAWDLGTDTITLGVAVHTPFTELSSFAPGSAARYHDIWQRVGVLEQTVAAAWQIEHHVAVGAALSFAESWLDYSFARDAALGGGSALVSNANSLCGGPCGLENPAAEQTVRLRGFAWGIGFSVGVLVRPIDRLWFGASYISRVYHHGAGGDLQLYEDHRGSVVPAPGQGAGVCLLTDGRRLCTGADRVILLVPDVVQVAARIEVTPTLDLEAQWRFVHYGARTTLDASLQGGSLGDLGPAANGTGVPSSFSLDRGLQNAYAVELSARLLVARPLRLMPSLMFESAAVASSAVGPAALDGPKLDGALTLEYKPWMSGDRRRAIVLGLHAGLTAVFIGHVASRFDPHAAVACVDASYRTGACMSADSGDALPSTSGNYTLFVLNAGAAIGFDY
jgi:long-subunit fatty acid transport protein